MLEAQHGPVVFARLDRDGGLQLLVELALPVELLVPVAAELLVDLADLRRLPISRLARLQPKDGRVSLIYLIRMVMRVTPDNFPHVPTPMLPRCIILCPVWFRHQVQKNQNRRQQQPLFQFHTT